MTPAELDEKLQHLEEVIEDAISDVKQISGGNDVGNVDLVLAGMGLDGALANVRRYRVMIADPDYG